MPHKKLFLKKKRICRIALRQILWDFFLTGLLIVVVSPAATAVVTILSILIVWAALSVLVIIAIPRSTLILLVILAVRRKGRHSGYEHNGCGQNRNLLFHTNSSLLLL